MTQRVVVNGTPAWWKTYGAGRRRLRLAALEALVQRLDLPPLLPPPHHAGAAAKRIEKERIRSLRATGATVPAILEERSDALLLSDIGPTLSTRLREARGDPGRTDELVATAVAAIGDVHRRGGYLSQAWPRNLTLHEGSVGFLDFEEDPCEVMSLAHAQARDWLLFAYGTMRYYRDRPGALSDLLRGSLRDAQTETVLGMERVAVRLQPLARRFERFGSSLWTLSQTLRVIRSALPILIGALLLCLGLDWIDDGRLGLLEDLVDLL